MTKGARILVVEDDRTTADLVALYLRHAGHQVWVEGDGARARARIAGEPFDLLVLDVMLPGATGLDLCREAVAGAAPAVIMLTARTQEHERITGLELGADDYVSKPFSPRELTARVAAVLRRRGPASSDSLVRGSLQLNAAHRRVTLEGQEVVLTSAEFALLHALALRPGLVHARSSLLGRFRDDHDDVNERTIDVHIRNLRRKIERDPSQPRWIQTVVGAGYRLVVPAETG